MQQQRTRANDAHVGEKGLLKAMVERAILDMYHDNWEIQRGAVKWLHLRDVDAPRRWSFCWCLEHLNIDPTLALERILLAVASDETMKGLKRC